VSIGATLSAIRAFKVSKLSWGWAFVAITILFNPIAPIYLHDKSTWAIFDIGSAIVFFASIGRVK